jgi:hypothetical protein
MKVFTVLMDWTYLNSQRYSVFRAGLNIILIYVCQDSREPVLRIQQGTPRYEPGILTVSLVTFYLWYI